MQYAAKARSCLALEHSIIASQSGRAFSATGLTNVTLWTATLWTCLLRWQFDLLSAHESSSIS